MPVPPPTLTSGRPSKVAAPTMKLSPTSPYTPSPPTYGTMSLHTTSPTKASPLCCRWRTGKKRRTMTTRASSSPEATVPCWLVWPTPNRLLTPPVFFAFHSFKPIKTLLPPTNGIIPELVGALGTSSPSARYIFYAVSYETDLDLYNDTYSSFVSCQHFTSPSKGVLQFGIQATTKAAVQAGEERGGSWPGMKPVSTNWWHTVTVWFDGNDDKAASAAANGMTANMTNLATDAGKYVEFEFQNDADVSQSPLKSYGEKNLQRFAAVAARYDLQQVFQKLQNSGFKISTA